MKCDNQGCDGNVHLTTFCGSVATECKTCDYIQMIPDNMVPHIKEMVEDIRPVVSFRKEYKADYRENLDCDLYRHYENMFMFENILFPDSYGAIKKLRSR